ncbi:MAG: hypothetical protein RLZZ146_224 [Bacteroidota bacterium]|jgi:uncharacterized membrane protein|nr:DUF502 domain-containing protein [Bacteroidia bacterium]
MSKAPFPLYDPLIKSRLRTPGQLFISYFLRGLLVVLPVAITVGILGWLLKGIGRYLYLDQLSVGAIFLYGTSGLLAIAVIGFFTKGVIAQQIMGFFEGIIEKAPGLNFIFGTTKDMTEAFVGEKKKFTKPVVVEISEGVYKIGFLTQEDMTAVGLPNCCAVYLPYSYTLSGETTVVEKSRVRRIEKESGDVTKFVLSGGATNLK